MRALLWALMPEFSPPRALTIAGSDSGGGAGIQADLKAFAAACVHGLSAITAITAQNTLEVRDVHQVPGPMIVAQVAAVADDIGVDAVKIGMLGTPEAVAAVDEALDLLPGHVPIVLDPVMVAESGAVLLADDAREALVELLVPRATVVTPNLAEARVLAGAPDEDDPERLAELVHALGPQAAVVTGGHGARADDYFFDGHLSIVQGERHREGAAHGSGCTHSATLAAYLARGRDPLEAAHHAKRAASDAVRYGLRGIGEGAGPVDVFGIGLETGDPAAHPPGAADRV
jgi:hydroxymethylpyrimidine/phosphomethylpyrimidine kinase